MLVEGQIVKNISMSIQPALVGLRTFGGVDPASGVVLDTPTFQVGFSQEACINAW